MLLVAGIFPVFPSYALSEFLPISHICNDACMFCFLLLLAVLEWANASLQLNLSKVKGFGWFVWTEGYVKQRNGFLKSDRGCIMIGRGYSERMCCFTMHRYVSSRDCSNVKGNDIVKLILINFIQYHPKYLSGPMQQSLSLLQVKWDARLEHEYVQNYKVRRRSLLRSK